MNTPRTIRFPNSTATSPLDPLIFDPALGALDGLALNQAGQSLLLELVAPIRRVAVLPDDGGANSLTLAACRPTPQWFRKWPPKSTKKDGWDFADGLTYSLGGWQILIHQKIHKFLSM